jgi:hypothetical protein
VNFAPHSDNLDRIVGFIKSSVLYQLVHIELDLRLSFYLKRSLRGYMVGTTMGFQAKIVEALPPKPHRRIP